MTGTPRVRFAPSPTGYLHVGGTRTALFNWLFARSRGGVFVLRIEDTDAARSTVESVSAILDSLRWLGMNWDEGPGREGEFGPYFQSQRRAIHRAYAERLLERGAAYRCFCTPEELKEKRTALQARKEAPHYDRRCLGVSGDELRSLLDSGRPHVLRFGVRSGLTVWEDAVKGRVEFSNSEFDDFIILRSDGTPTYNFAAAVDDITMRISHVIRGDEHVSNTPRQILLYEALGEALPVFAHIPMILGPDGSKLSKRHGAVALSHYERQGFISEAMVNFLALLGWSFDGKQEVFSVEELVRKFSLERVSSNPSVFNHEKLLWLNAQYMKKLSAEQRTEMIIRYLTEVKGMKGLDSKRDWVGAVTQVMGERLRVASQIDERGDFFFTESVHYDEKAAELLLSNEGGAELLTRIAASFRRVEDWRSQAIEENLRGLAQELGLKAAELIHPARAALTGHTTSPGIFEVTELLGKKECLERLGAASKFVSQAEG
ncbi:MAG: glutamate--tRNA ligase [Candidatus Eisenbacteria bacterium]